MNRTAAAYKYEMKKLLAARRGWIILLCAVLLQIGIACVASPFRYYSFDKGLYKEYTELYAGPYSAETARIIDATKAVNDRIMGQYSFPDDTSSEEMMKLSNRTRLASLKGMALSEIQTKYAMLASCRDMHPEMTYDLDLTEYFRKFGLNWASLFGMALLIPMLMLGDANCGMEQILYPTVTGQKCITGAKLLAGCTVSTGLTAVCSVLQWIIFSLRWDFCSLRVPLQSLTGFEGSMLRSSIGGCLVLFGLIRILAAPAAAFLLSLLSVLIRKEPAVITAGAVIIGCSAILASKIGFFPVFSLYSALSGISAAKTLSGTDTGFLIFFLLVKTALLGCAAWALARKKR